MNRRRFLAVMLRVAARAGARAGATIPRSSAASRSRFRATTAAIPRSAPSGGTSPGWVRDARGRELGVQVTFFRTRPGVAEDEREPVRADAAHVRACGDRRSRARPAAPRPARRARGFGLARRREGTTDVAIGDWSLRSPATRYATRIVARDFALDARRSRPTQPLLLQGDAG